MLRLVPFNEQYLKRSYDWLNDPEIRKLTDGPVSVSREEQEKWYEFIQNDATYKIWGIERGGEPIGACGIKHINYEKHSGEYWGYIGEKQYWGGNGHQLMNLIYSKAKELHLNELCLFVLKTNSRAKRLYISEGFIIEYENEDRVWMRKSCEETS